MRSAIWVRTAVYEFPTLDAIECLCLQDNPIKQDLATLNGVEESGAAGQIGLRALSRVVLVFKSEPELAQLVPILMIHLSCARVHQWNRGLARCLVVTVS